MQLTWAGKVFSEDARRILLVIEQTKGNVRAAAAGFHGRLRIALSDGIAQARLTALLALCREEELDIEIRLFEMPLSQQLKGLKNDLYDAGFTLFDGLKAGVVAQPAWQDPIVVAIPPRHPLLAHKRVALREVLNFPLVLCNPETCAGCNQQLERLLRSIEDAQPQVAECVSPTDLMLTLVAAGYGVGFSNAAYVATCRHPEVVVRPLAGRNLALTTFLLRSNAAPSEQLSRFMERVVRIGSKPAILEN
ncbi:MAG: LysR family substrate-binding domain-containing protein [Rhodocyclaceae bacterium]